MPNNIEEGLVGLHEKKLSSLEELYGITKKDVQLRRVKTKSGKYLEWFKSPGPCTVEIEFPEFTCRCPRTSQPDFATITLRYIPNERCVELKALKYYFNSFRDEGHFHEQCVELIYQDLMKAIKPSKLQIVGNFNVRGGTYPKITRGEWLSVEQKVELLEP